MSLLQTLCFLCCRLLVTSAAEACGGQWPFVFCCSLAWAHAKKYWLELQACVLTQNSGRSVRTRFFGSGPLRLEGLNTAHYCHNPVFMSHCRNMSMYACGRKLQKNNMSCTSYVTCIHLLLRHWRARALCSGYQSGVMMLKIRCPPAIPLSRLCPG